MARRGCGDLSPVRVLLAALTLVSLVVGCEGAGTSRYPVYSAAVDAVADSLPMAFRPPLVILDSTTVPIPDPFGRGSAEALRHEMPSLSRRLLDRASGAWTTGGILADSFSLNVPYTLLKGTLAERLRTADAETRRAMIKNQFGSDATVVCLAPVAIDNDHALAFVSSGCGVQGPSFTAATVVLVRRDRIWQAQRVLMTQVN